MRPCRLLPVLRERNRHDCVASLGGVVDAVSLVPIDLLALIAVRSSELLLVAELLWVVLEMLGRDLADAIREVLKPQVHGVDLRGALHRGRPGRLHTGPYRRFSQSRRARLRRRQRRAAG